MTSTRVEGTCVYWNHTDSSLVINTSMTSLTALKFILTFDKGIIYYVIIMSLQWNLDYPVLVSKICLHFFNAVFCINRKFNRNIATPSKFRLIWHCSLIQPNSNLSCSKGSTDCISNYTLTPQ